MKLKNSNKKGAIQMTMGTIVTIVLMVAILIVLLFFVNKVKGSGEKALTGIDQAIQTKMNELFTSGTKIVVYPVSREIELKKGDSAKGIGFSIKNVEKNETTFSYTVSAKEIASDCSITLEQANSFITLGKSGQATLPSGSTMDPPVFVRFNIPETAPLCDIRYGIDVKKGDGKQYSPTIFFDVKIK